VVGLPDKMKIEVLLRAFGSLMRILGLLMLVPGIVAAYYGEISGVISFGLTALITLGVGSALRTLGPDEEMGNREAFALVALGWMGAALFGALPYLFLGISPVDALFESMSGFTTTGASIMTESCDGYWIINRTLAEGSIAYGLARSLPHYILPQAGFSSNITLAMASNLTQNLTYNATGPLAWANNSTLPAILPYLTIKGTIKGLLFWRSLSQWLGGMGIILLFIAILPKLGVAGRQLFKAEVPGPEKDALTPRIRGTAKILWGVYVVLTAIEVVLLWLAGIGLYDALCNSFASMATGGFSPRALSIAHYQSPLIDWIIIIFIFLAGANFALHYRTIHTDHRSLIRDREFRIYAMIILIATIVLIVAGGMGAIYLGDGRDASNVNLVCVNLSGADLTDLGGGDYFKQYNVSSIGNLSLIQANLSNLTACDVSLPMVSLRGVNLTGYRIHGGDIVGGELHGGRLERGSPYWEMGGRFRFAIFQVVSIMTTTGFATADFDGWSTAAKATLLLLMFIGACAGSTGGAIKVVRVLLAVKYAHRELLRAIHPTAIIPIKLGDSPVKEEILHSSLVFFALYLLIFAAASLLLAIVTSLDGSMDLVTVASAVATTLGNVGPGFGMVGPTLSFAELHPLGKMILLLCMWIGRLEIITALLIFIPDFWER